jgi:hypothetical protein
MREFESLEGTGLEIWVVSKPWVIPEQVPEIDTRADGCGNTVVII